VRAYSVLGSTQGKRAVLFSWKSRHAPVGGLLGCERVFAYTIAVSLELRVATRRRIYSPANLTLID
jgi:hypothetical protein